MLRSAVYGTIQVSHISREQSKQFQLLELLVDVDETETGLLGSFAATATVFEIAHFGR
jgi:hypothetical protein